MNKKIDVTFTPATSPIPTPTSPGWWFIFHKRQLLVQETTDNLTIPLFKNVSISGLKIIRSIYLGELDGAPCFAAAASQVGDLPKQTQFRELRPLFGEMEDFLFWIAGRASHILHWDEITRHCGRCGSLFQFKDDEYAKICPDCRLVNYPGVAPAIIVVVTNGNQILLAKSVRFKQEIYSVLAGFVEPGESLEACVKREVREEVGIEVKNISYFASQPWPFPNSLMVGFTAEYAGGDIRISEEEIDDANWYTADNLPPIPGPPSIARRLIDSFIQKKSST